MRNCILLVFLLGQVINLQAQTHESPYKISAEQEIRFGMIGAVTLGLGGYLKQKNIGFTEAQVNNLSKSDLLFFDRPTPGFNSNQADHASDVLLYGSLLVNTSFLVFKETRKDFGQIALLWGETAAINVGFTRIFKHSFKRPRPYVYNSEVDVNKKLKASSRTSFFSGHTSITAANTFFFAKVYSDYYPDSSWKPIVWTVAAVVPATTAYLRVKAGKHFPSDVIIGYAVGASIGILVPHFHKRKKSNEKGLSVYGGGSGLALNYRF